MARGAWKLRQNIYVTIKSEVQDGISRYVEYSTPVKYRLSVSHTAGFPSVFSTGLVPDYDREITVYAGQLTGFNPPEGALLYVDVEPMLDANGDIVLDENYEPTVLPDYVLVRRLSTMRGKVAKYGIKRVAYGISD